MSFFKPVPLSDYRKCTLSQGKEWVIYYYVKNPETGKLQRVRIKVNRIRSIKERKRQAKEIMAAIDQRLVLGWNPLLEAKAPRAFVPLYTALDDFLQIKKREMEESSWRTYSSLVKSFKRWLEGEGIDGKSYACSATAELALKYMNMVEKKMSARTYNNYIGFYKGMFRWMMERGYVGDNPFERIAKKSKRLLKKNRRMLTDDELRTVLQFVRDENKEYLAMCLLCYCCFIRPKEIALLRCSDIDLQGQLIHVRSEIAKNDNESYRTIPDDIMPVMRELDLSHKDWFLFGENDGPGNFAPSKVQVCSRKIAKWWDRRVRKACGFSNEVKFYSLKDTGITNMLGKGVPINLVQQQADHSSVAMTAIYVGHRQEATKELREADIVTM